MFKDINDVILINKRLKGILVYGIFDSFILIGIRYQGLLKWYRVFSFYSEDEKQHIIGVLISYHFKEV